MSPTNILALPINSQSSRTPIAADINSQLLVLAISLRAYINHVIHKFELN